MFPYEDFGIVSVHLSVPREKNRPSFINISPTVVIDTSMERSSEYLLQHGNSKILFSFQKRLKLNFKLYSDVLK